MWKMMEMWFMLRNGEDIIYEQRIKIFKCMYRWKGKKNS